MATFLNKTGLGQNLE